MKPKYRRENVQPRPGETHGLFGVKFLKHHNMRDPNWTSEDLITQYEKLSNIFREFWLLFCELSFIGSNQAKPTTLLTCKENKMRSKPSTITNAWRRNSRTNMNFCKPFSKATSSEQKTCFRIIRCISEHTRTSSRMKFSRSWVSKLFKNVKNLISTWAKSEN